MADNENSVDGWLRGDDRQVQNRLVMGLPAPSVETRIIEAGNVVGKTDLALGKSVEQALMDLEEMFEKTEPHRRAVLAEVDGTAKAT